MALTPIPWLTILLTLLAFFSSKKTGASDTTALMTAGLVGAGSYYVSHETEWGQANLAALDGVQPMLTTTPVLDANGQQIIDPVTGLAIKTSVPNADGKTTATGTGVLDVLKSWGATGTAAVIGTAAVATGSSSTLSKYLVPGLLVGALVFALK